MVLDYHITRNIARYESLIIILFVILQIVAGQSPGDNMTEICIVRIKNIYSMCNILSKYLFFITPRSYYVYYYYRKDKREWSVPTSPIIEIPPKKSFLVSIKTCDYIMRWYNNITFFSMLPKAKIRYSKKGIHLRSYLFCTSKEI